MCDECSAECRFYASGITTIENIPEETKRLGTWNCTLPPGILNYNVLSAIHSFNINTESTDTIVDNIELPTNAVQCPITYPFPRYRTAITVEACCKCGDQSKCILVTDITDRTGINSYNIGGVNAMLAADGAVDECKSKYVKDHKINILLV